MAEPTPYQPPSDLPQLGAYRVVAELARGGMAAVFLGVSVAQPPRVVAIKQIHAHLAHDPDFVAMLVDEARIATMIHHPNVVEILEYSLGQIGMQNYLVMEYADGEALNLVMRAASTRGVRLDYDLAATVAADVAAGLHCAHELRGPAGELLELVHRDVSPQNIIVTYDGRVMLTDFGIAKAVGRLQRTHPGEIKGKLAYMSPEQAFGRPVDRRSDVYSLGIVLYELALGRRLFGGKSDAETVKNIMNQVVVPPRTVDPSFPAGLEEIILAMLTSDVNQRFQSAGAVERALRAFAASAGPGNIETRRGELVRTLEPARHEAKSALIARELSRPVPLVLPVSSVASVSSVARDQTAEPGSEAPTLSRLENAAAVAVARVSSAPPARPSQAPAATSPSAPSSPTPSALSPTSSPTPPSSPPVAGPARVSTPPVDFDKTFQAPAPRGVSRPPPVVAATMIAAPPAEALQTIAAIEAARRTATSQAVQGPRAPAPAPAPASRTGIIVVVLLLVGVVLSGGLYVLIRALQ